MLVRVVWGILGARPLSLPTTYFLPWHHTICHIFQKEGKYTGKKGGWSEIRK
jgi:hypothetical protein